MGDMFRVYGRACPGCLNLVNFWPILGRKGVFGHVFRKKLHVSKLDLLGQSCWALKKNEIFLFLVSDQCAPYWWRKTARLQARAEELPGKSRRGGGLPRSWLIMLSRHPPLQALALLRQLSFAPPTPFRHRCHPPRRGRP